MATIIFSNMGDTDTAVLRNLWNGMPDVKVVEIGKFTRNARRMVDEAIAQETEMLVMCGHGTPEGLINPNFTDYDRYLIDRRNKDLIRVISNLMEAHYNHIYNTDAGTITHDETMFCLFTNYLIRNNVPQENWIDVLCKCVDFNDPVIRFNYSGLVYYAEAPKPKYNYDYWYRTMGFENARWWG